ncbi:hypothetical protein GE21DRAFT_1349103 [Neurospora crassa]|nr:hypothetical protein GE21DRAFT_1349103 [Neurospora crassa]
MTSPSYAPTKSTAALAMSQIFCFEECQVDCPLTATSFGQIIKWQMTDDKHFLF